MKKKQNQIVKKKTNFEIKINEKNNFEIKALHELIFILKIVNIFFKQICKR